MPKGRKPPKNLSNSKESNSESAPKNESSEEPPRERQDAESKGPEENVPPESEQGGTKEPEEEEVQTPGRGISEEPIEAAVERLPEESKAKQEEESGLKPKDNQQEPTDHKEHGTKKHNELIDHKSRSENVGKEPNREHLAVSATSPKPRNVNYNPNARHKIIDGKGQVVPSRPIQPTSKSSNESGPTAIPIEEECAEPGKSISILLAFN